MMLRVGIVISLILHVLILAWALVEMRSVREFAKVEPTPVSIDLLQIADKTDLKAGDSKAKPKAVKAAEDKPKVEAEKPKRVAVEPPKVEPPKVEPAKVEPAKVEPPKVEPKKEEPKKEEPKADPKKVEDAAKVEPPKPDAVDPVAELLKKEEEQKAADAKKAADAQKAEDDKKAAEAKKAADAKKAAADAKKEEAKKAAAKSQDFKDKIAALLNKIPNAASKPASKVAAPDPTAKDTDPALGGEKSKGQQLSIIEKNAWIAQIRTKLGQCWSPPVGGADAQSIAVPLGFELKRDGTLNGEPRIVANSGDPLFQVAAESALRALIQCQPYDMFPPDQYDLWKSWRLNFKPAEMF